MHARSEALAVVSDQGQVDHKMARVVKLGHWPSFLLYSVQAQDVDVKEMRPAAAVRSLVAADVSLIALHQADADLTEDKTRRLRPHMHALMGGLGGKCVGDASICNQKCSSDCLCGAVIAAPCNRLSTGVVSLF